MWISILKLLCSWWYMQIDTTTQYRVIDLTTGIWEAGAVLRYQNVVMEDTLEKEKKNIKLTFSGLRHVIKILKNMFD